MVKVEKMTLIEKNTQKAIEKLFGGGDNPIYLSFLDSTVVERSITDRKAPGSNHRGV